MTGVVSGSATRSPSSESSWDGRRGVLGAGHDVGERAVVVEQDEPSLGFVEGRLERFEVGGGPILVGDVAGLGRGLAQALHEALGPQHRVALVDPVVQRGHALGALVTIHLQRSLEGLGRTHLVVGIDAQGLAQLVGSAGELAQQEHPGAIGLAGHVLLGHQVHAIAEGTDPGHVSG